MKVEENAVLKDINLSAAMKKTARNIAWRMYKSRGPKKKKKKYYKELCTLLLTKNATFICHVIIPPLVHDITKD